MITEWLFLVGCHDFRGNLVPSGVIKIVFSSRPDEMEVFAGWMLGVQAVSVISSKAINRALIFLSGIFSIIFTNGVRL